MLASTTLRWTLSSLGCSAIVLFAASPTDTSAPPQSPLESPPKTAAPLAATADEEPPTPVHPPVVKLSEAEVAEALKIMKQLDDDPLVGTLMEYPPAARKSTAQAELPTGKPAAETPEGPVELLRQTARRVDGLAHRLEADDLYESADQLRASADRLRRQARRIRQNEPQPEPSSPVFTRRPSRRFPRR